MGQNDGPRMTTANHIIMLLQNKQQVILKHPDDWRSKSFRLSEELSADSKETGIWHYEIHHGMGYRVVSGTDSMKDEIQKLLDAGFEIMVSNNTVKNKNTENDMTSFVRSL